jgi:hypothetical protein
MNIRRIIFIPLERRRGNSTSGGVKAFIATLPTPPNKLDKHPSKITPYYWIPACAGMTGAGLMRMLLHPAKAFRSQIRRASAAIALQKGSSAHSV